jgi:putative effector of murein hydrolase LrgA (UPF0299 family)
VIGMMLLAAGLAVRERRTEQTGPTPLDRLSGLLLKHMGLLFVPAGVGLVAAAGLLKRDWLPIAGGVVGSTVLSLAVTGFVMHRITRTRGEAAERREASR